jgi:uncharacterized protein (TIGR03067 family)
MALLLVFSLGCGKKSSPTSESQVPTPAADPKQKRNLSPNPSPNPPAEADADLLQGTWVVEAAELDGKKASAAELKDLLLIFKDDQMITKKPGGSESGIFKLDPTKTPKNIEIGQSERDTTDMAPGIYELNGDNLKICFTRGRDVNRAKRPSTFETKPGSNMMLWVLKRDKGAAPHKDPDVSGFPKAIIGKWKWEGGETNFPFLFDTEFTNDGRVLQLDPFKKAWVEKYKYRFEKGTLVLTLPEKNIYGKTEERVRITSISDDLLIAESPTGKLNRLK